MAKSFPISQNMFHIFLSFEFCTQFVNFHQTYYALSLSGQATSSTLWHCKKHYAVATKNNFFPAVDKTKFLIALVYHL